MKRLLLIFFSSVAVVILCTLPALAGSLALITTLPATNIGYTTATLNARAPILSPGVNRNGNNIIFVDGFFEKVYFKYGTSPGNLTNQTPPSDVTGSMVMANITGLRPGTTYYAEAVLIHHNYRSRHKQSPRSGGIFNNTLFPGLAVQRYAWGWCGAGCHPCHHLVSRWQYYQLHHFNSRWWSIRFNLLLWAQQHRQAKSPI